MRRVQWLPDIQTNPPTTMVHLKWGRTSASNITGESNPAPTNKNKNKQTKEKHSRDASSVLQSRMAFPHKTHKQTKQKDRGQQDKQNNRTEQRRMADPTRTPVRKTHPTEVGTPRRSSQPGAITGLKLGQGKTTVANRADNARRTPLTVKIT